ncbi:MAG: hypothetical protein LBL79_09615 [Prevotella sp.]|jgi:Tol biopolymer transport system component|nr:hypothetical protein [Prevotella sp.]
MKTLYIFFIAFVLITLNACEQDPWGPQAVYIHSPVASPDGRKIAYISNPDNHNRFKIYLVDIDGKNIKSLGEEISWTNYISWSPDGSLLAYSDGILTLQGDKVTGFRPMNVPDKRLDEPDWSPDGKTILFRTNMELHLTDPFFKNIRKLPFTGEHPKWHPNGKDIIYTEDNNIFVSDTLIQNKVQLTNTGTLDIPFFYPSFSPDGKMIVYQNRVYGGRSTQMFVMNSDGSNPVLLDEGFSPVWTPDSKHIIYVKKEDGDNLWKISIEDKSKEKLTEYTYSKSH